MESIFDLLTPEQIDAIVSVYGSVEEWVIQVAESCLTITEDIFL